MITVDTWGKGFACSVLGGRIRKEIGCRGDHEWQQSGTKEIRCSFCEVVTWSLRDLVVISKVRKIEHELFFCLIYHR